MSRTAIATWSKRHRPSGAGPRSRLIVIDRLPELNQRAESGAWRDEGGATPVGQIVVVNDAHAAALSAADDRIEAVDLKDR